MTEGEAVDLSSLRTGPFISGTTHAILRLGQPPIQAYTNKARQMEYAEQRPAKRAKTEAAKSAKDSVTLKDLIDASLLTPGKNKLSVSYKGITYLASLQPDGTILYQGDLFNTASDFSLHVKSFQTPGKQSDDGWKSVTYGGNSLEDVKKEFTTPSKAAKDGEEDIEGHPQGEEDTDQWVQCDRCKTWRCVPDSDWALVEADERTDWLCEFATWDVAKHAPFKEACKK